jgi:hypothetical protein
MAEVNFLVKKGLTVPKGSASTPSVIFDASDPNTGLYSPGADQVAVATNGTGRLFVDASGRVGVGTASPAWKLDVKQSDDQNGITLRSNVNDSQLRIVNNNGNFWQITATYGSSGSYQPITFLTSDSERMRLDTSGRLLVGTASTSTNLRALIQATSANSAGGGNLYLARGESTPADGASLGYLGFSDSNHNSAAGLEAVRDGGTWTSGSSQPSRLVFSTTADGASSPTERVRIANTGATDIFSSTANVLGAGSNQAAGTVYYLFYGANNASSTTTGTTCFVVFTNGNVQNTNNSYAGISDAKLKENIVDATSQWSDIKALQVRKYNFKEGQTHTQIGLIAQEVELISPGLVIESPDRDAEGNDLGTVTKSVNYSVLYMKAVKALQEAMERIETLEGMVAVNNITIDEQQHQLSTLTARLTALESA